MNVRYQFISRLIAASLLSLLAVSVVHAKDDGTDPSVTVEKEVQHFIINKDGSFEATFDIVRLINEERAIKTQGQQSVPYNRTLDSLEFTSAYTQKPDGRKVIVQPDQIKDQQEQASANAPMFQDTRIKIAIFPEVAVGDRIVFQYKKKRATPMFPGNFYDISMPHFHPTKQFTLIYDVPESVTLYSEADGFTPSTPKAIAGRKIYQWDYVPSKHARIERGAVSYSDFGQYVRVSTFADYAAFAQAYDSRAKDKTTVVPQIVELAKSLTAGLTDPRAKALALNEWVRKNIRYVAVYIGAGGVVPHAADKILENRYGDCKDHVTLLEAMLTAVGIDSTPALINLGNAYKLGKVPTLGILNHVITYIPTLDLYLDSTADSIAGGFLPPGDVDKPVILTKTGVIGHTPAVQVTNATNQIVFKINPTGAADFTYDNTVKGWTAELSRYSIRNVKQADRDLLVQRILTGYQLKGAGTLDVGNLDAKSDEYKLIFKGNIENLVNLPGPIGVPSLTSLVGGIAQTLMGAASEKERTQTFMCMSSNMDETARFEFPKEINIVATPKPVVLKDALFDYESSYTKDGNAVVVRRQFKLHHPSSTCTAADFKIMQPSIDKMIKDIRSQIIVEGL